MDVSRNSDEVAVLVDEAVDCLADPKGAIRGEFEALSAIEFLDGVLQTNIALLNKVFEFEGTCNGILFGHADYETQVPENEAFFGSRGSLYCSFELLQLLQVSVLAPFHVLRRALAGPDLFGEADLFLLGQQWILTDFIEVEGQGVGQSLRHGDEGGPLSEQDNGFLVPSHFRP